MFNTNVPATSILNSSSELVEFLCWFVFFQKLLLASKDIGYVNEVEVRSATAKPVLEVEPNNTTLDFVLLLLV